MLLGMNLFYDKQAGFYAYVKSQVYLVPDVTQSALRICLFGVSFAVP
jgi:hypothetical protein